MKQDYYLRIFLSELKNIDARRFFQVYSNEDVTYTSVFHDPDKKKKKERKKDERRKTTNESIQLDN